MEKVAESNQVHFTYFTVISVFLSLKSHIQKNVFVKSDLARFGAFSHGLHLQIWACFHGAGDVQMFHSFEHFNIEFEGLFLALRAAVHKIMSLQGQFSISISQLQFAAQILRWEVLKVLNGLPCECEHCLCCYQTVTRGRLSPK